MIENLAVVRNTSFRSGGGAMFSSSEVNLSKCEFTANESNSGAAICSTGQLRVTTSGFYGHMAHNARGVIRGAMSRNTNYTVLYVLENCTFAGNRGEYIVTSRYAATPLVLKNCVISNVDRVVNEGLTDVAFEYNLVEHDSTGIASENGNITCDPCFVNPGYWDSNNTPDDPNDDFFVAGDYHLKSQAGRWDSNSETWVYNDVTSPCIDAGDPNSPIMYEPFPNGGRINMGAYGGTEEASKSYFGCAPCETIIAGDINGDCKVNYLDLAILASHWLE